MSNLIETNQNELQSANPEVEILISTAQKYKRNLAECREEAIQQIESSLELAEQCNYSLPFRDKKTGKTEFVRGASVRLAEIAACAYGNIRSASRIINITSQYATVETVVWDVQKNLHRIEQIIEPIRFRGGEVMAIQSGISKSYRNALFRGILPRAWINELADKALEFVLNGGKKELDKPKKSFETRRKEIFDALEKREVPLPSIFALFNKNKIEDFNQDDLKEVIGIGTAIKDGMIKLEDIFNTVDNYSASSVEERLKNLLEPKQEEPIKQEKPGVEFDL